MIKCLFLNNNLKFSISLHDQNSVELKRTLIVFTTFIRNLPYIRESENYLFVHIYNIYYNIHVYY